jgi:tellurite methyltransferase
MPEPAARRRPRSPWEREYARTPRRYIWGTEASPLARATAHLLPRRARVLELGCGEGRDSVFFAGQGLEVTGLDVSPHGLQKAKQLAGARRVQVRWVCEGLPRLSVAGPFELVYSCGAVHYVARGARARLFRRLRGLTPPGGYHAHVVFTDRQIHVEKGERIDYFRPGELARAYAGWTILDNAEGLIFCAQDGTLHVHSVEAIVARRPTRRLRAVSRKLRAGAAGRHRSRERGRLS